VEGVPPHRDAALRQELVGLYQRGLDKPVAAPRSGLDPSCPLVRQHLCAGSTEAIAVDLRIERPDLAEQLRVSAGRDFGCSEK